MTPVKSSLSPGRRRLLELLQRLNFGRIERLEIRDGEPVLDPSPIVLREYKFAGANDPRPESHLVDFKLKLQQVDLLNLLDRIGTGTLRELTFKHGLPFHAEIPIAAI